MTDRSTAQGNATQISGETTPGANTAARVGGALQQLATKAAFTEDVSALATDMQALGVPAAGASGKLADAQHVHPNDQIIQVAIATTAALPAYTYANGASGVGATITMNANGALAAINGYTPQLNDLILVKYGASLSDCGIYKYTTVGTGGTPSVLTRSTLADTPVKLTAIKAVQVVNGIGANRGQLFELLTSGAIAIGTSALVFVRVNQIGQYTTGFSIVEDFRMGVAAPAAGAAFGDTNMIANPAGTSAAVTTNSNSGTGNTGTEIGIATFSTGSTATGSAGVNTLGNTCAMFATNSAVFFSTKVNIPTASTGAQQHRVEIGGSPSQASSVWVQADAVVNANFQLNVKSATAGGTTTVTGSVGPSGGSTYDEIIVWKDAGSNQIHWAINAVQQTDPATTNTPIADLVGPLWNHQKVAGITTAATSKWDWCICKVNLSTERAA